MRLLHYAEAPTVLDRGRTYDQRNLRGTGKPDGLWVSVEGEDDWKGWCEAEAFALHCLEYVHEVTLTEGANVLMISTGKELEAFHAQWSVEDEFNRKMAERERDLWGADLARAERFRRNHWPVQWKKVAAEYDGIIIAPYLWSHRLDGPFWYYGVDCASGCIWNLDAIDRFEEVQ